LEKEAKRIFPSLREGVIATTKQSRLLSHLEKFLMPTASVGLVLAFIVSKGTRGIDTPLQDFQSQIKIFYREKITNIFFVYLQAF